MLPKAIAKRRSDMIKKSSLNQSVLDGHLRERPTTEWVMPYSDQLFREVATEWLILTDQVCWLHYYFHYAMLFNCKN